PPAWVPVRATWRFPSDSATAALFHGQWSERTRRSPSDTGKAALRKLDMLNAAHELLDIRVLPGNRLASLDGNRPNRRGVRTRCGRGEPRACGSLERQADRVGQESGPRARREEARCDIERTAAIGWGHTNPRRLPRPD